jgi:hypothetical protein
LWVIFALLDPDPATHVNADSSGSGSTTLIATYSRVNFPLRSPGKIPSSSLLSRGLTRFLERPVAVAAVDEAEGLLLLAVEAVAVLMRGIVALLC